MFEMNRVAEHQEKVTRLEKLMAEKGLDGICLFKFMNYSWLSAGGTNRVVTGSERGCSVLVVMSDGKKYVAAPANEISRITQEETVGLGFEAITFPWYHNVAEKISKTVAGKKLGSDVPIPGMECISDDIDRLRFNLTIWEQTKAKELAGICSDEMAALCAGLQPGLSEQQIAAELSSRLLSKGVKPAVLLIGVDERLGYCRHPIVTDKKLSNYGLVSLVGEKAGLHVTLTRSVHFGPIPAELKEKHRKACIVDVEMCEATKAGAAVDDIFALCKDTYAEVGFPGEWELHHQGGAIGYASREYRAGERKELVVAGQMFGWNPTVQGAKSEETILVNTAGQPEVITSTPAWWPKEKFGKQGIERPLILEF